MLHRHDKEHMHFDSARLVFDKGIMNLYGCGCKRNSLIINSRERSQSTDTKDANLSIRVRIYSKVLE